MPECILPLPLPPFGGVLSGANFKNMIAVVKIGGQQFKVEKDQTLYVPHLEGKAGDKLEFSEVVMADNDGKLTLGAGVKTKVKAEIIDHVQGDKVIAYKQKRRKGFRKKLGHRTLYTQIRIKDIKQETSKSKTSTEKSES